MLRIGILGGGYAGLIAARRIAAALPGRAQVTLFNARDHLVERIRLHQVAAGQTLKRFALRPLLGEAALEVTPVLAIEPEGRAVVTGAGRRQLDIIVNTLGSVTARRIAGAEHALTLDTPETAAAVHAACQRALAGRAPVAIVGGGLTAIELAAELKEAWPALGVALYCHGELGGGAFAPDVAAYVGRALASRGIALYEHTAVAAIEPRALVLEHDRHPIAAAVLCAGFSPSPLARQAGLLVDDCGSMRVDVNLQQREGIFGAGDAVTVDGDVGAPLNMSCKTASVMAVRCADNVIASVRGRALMPLRFGDTGICVSLGRKDGVIQMRAPDGKHLHAILGRRGAWIKEQVCRSTVHALRWPIWLHALDRYDSRGKTLVQSRAAALRSLAT